MLKFNTYIDENFYEPYEDEIRTFSLIHRQALLESLQEYRIHKRNIKRFCKIAKKNRVIANAIKNEETKYSNDFWDTSIAWFMEKKKYGDLAWSQPYYVPGFRFESYNSYDFKSEPTFKNKFNRSLSEEKDDE